MKKFILLLAIVMFFGLTADTFAQGRGDRRRIRSGIRSGQITRDEARALRTQRRQIRQEQRAYRSDGTLTREERREIRRDRREYDRLIRSERRDDDRRNGYSYGRRNHRRGDGYYRRGAGSPTHPVFGTRNGRRGRN
jgi:Spy/CpxP family protein refolding chaperone